MKNFSVDYKKDFPIFNGKNIVYLDSAATTQKPECVLEDMRNFYKFSNANPYRGAYGLSVEATQVYNDARKVVADFIGAQKSEEVIFTKNATESLNLLAYSYGLDNLKKGDEVVLTILEHHSNLVPWQQIVKRKGAKLVYLYINENFEIEDKEIERKITDKTKIVCITHVSNVTGTVNDVEKIVKKAHSVGAVAVVDACQSIAHMKVDVRKMDADFLAFSAHKMFGPLGVGVLYGKHDLLEKMTPFLMGGDMIEFVKEQSTTFADLPNKFEAGTQNVGGAVGLASAIKYINSIGYKNIQKIEKELRDYAYACLSKLPYIDVYSPKNGLSVISFNMSKVHPHDVASLLDSYGVCVRSGNHCAQPLGRFLNVEGTCRISFSIYNSKKDVDALVEGLKKIYNKFEKYIKD